LCKIQRLTLSDGVQEFFKKLKRRDLSWNHALVQLMVQARLRVGEVSKLCAVDVVIQSRSGLVRIQEDH
jgi:aromatic ring hydroxylase